MARKPSTSATTKPTGKKLTLSKETVRDLAAGKKDVKGGMLPETRWTYCGQGGPTDCYKPNPY